ncbi:MAG: hypothetical protein ACK56F_26685, partial [bacterium]
ICRAQDLNDQFPLRGLLPDSYFDLIPDDTFNTSEEVKQEVIDTEEVEQITQATGAPSAFILRPDQTEYCFGTLIQPGEEDQQAIYDQIKRESARSSNNA